MTTLASIMDIGLLQQMLEEGYVRQQVHPDDNTFVILNYTEKAAFGKVWNEVTLQCRGLIVRRPEGIESTIVARPFPKFFNYGENGKQFFDYDLEAECEVTDKMDGSLGILYEGPDGPAIATRGSFASDQALHATKVYRERYEGTWKPLTDKYTYLFEIIFPENRIVCDYGDRDDLVALGMVKKETGCIFGPVSAHYVDGWSGPLAEVFVEDSLPSALKRKPREGAEGVVVRFRASNEMVKIKQDDYVALHRIIFGLNERAVWQRLFDGDQAKDINRDLPEEFHPWVDKVANRIVHEAFAIVDAACDDFAAILRVIGPQPQGHTGFEFEQDVERARKKWFASLAVKSEHRGHLFLLYDDKSLHEAIFKQIRPEAVNYSKEAA